MKDFAPAEVAGMIMIFFIAPFFRNRGFRAMVRIKNVNFIQKDIFVAKGPQKLIFL